MYQIKQDPIVLASLLYATYISSGYLDDLDEIIADKIEDRSTTNMNKVWTWVNEFDIGIAFINEHLNKDLTISAVGEFRYQTM